MKIREIYEYLNGIAPFSSQAEWDNSGFLVGDANADFNKALICLDVTSELLDKAKKEGCELIISHHPIIFKGCKTLTSESLVFKAVKFGLSVISVHTNLDKAVGGVNDALCELLGMSFYKCPENVADGFLNIGTFEREYDAKNFARYISEKLGGAVSFSDSKRPVTKVAVCSGSGEDFISDALALGCDGYVTGEASYHSMLDGKDRGISVFAAGHYETEIPVINVLTEKLRNKFTDAEFFPFIPESPVSTVK